MYNGVFSFHEKQPNRIGERHWLGIRVSIGRAGSVKQAVVFKRERMEKEQTDSAAEPERLKLMAIVNIEVMERKRYKNVSMDGRGMLEDSKDKESGDSGGEQSRWGRRRKEERKEAGDRVYVILDGRQTGCNADRFRGA